VHPGVDLPRVKYHDDTASLYLPAIHFAVGVGQAEGLGALSPGATAWFSVKVGPFLFTGALGSVASCLGRCVQGHHEIMGTSETGKCDRTPKPKAGDRESPDDQLEETVDSA